jgi:hypothetical protein
MEKCNVSRCGVLAFCSGTVLSSLKIQSFSRATYSDLRGAYAQSSVPGGNLVFPKVVFVLAGEVRGIYPHIVEMNMPVRLQHIILKGCGYAPNRPGG